MIVILWDFKRFEPPFPTLHWICHKSCEKLFPSKIVAVAEVEYYVESVSFVKKMLLPKTLLERMRYRRNKSGNLKIVCAKKAAESYSK